jgi:hypothetical protein
VPTLNQTSDKLLIVFGKNHEEIFVKFATAKVNGEIMTLELKDSKNQTRLSCKCKAKSSSYGIKGKKVGGKQKSR